MGRKFWELLYGGNHFIRPNMSTAFYLNSMFYHSSREALNFQWYQNEFPKVKELTHSLANVDAVNGRLVDINSNSTVFDDDIEREMCTFKSLVREFVGSPLVQHRMKHFLASFLTNVKDESFTPFGTATERKPMVVDSLTKVSNFLSVSAQQRKLVRFRVCPQVTQHRIWTGALKEVLNGFAVDLDCLASRGLDNDALLGGQIVHSCLRFLTEIGVFSEPESSSWMKLSPSKTVDSSDSRRWEDVLVMLNDLTKCCRNERRLKMNVAKAEIMKEGLLHIRDVLVDSNVGYKEAQHQESLVKKKLSKMLGHSSCCLFTLLLYYLYGRVADIEVDMCGGVYANGSDGKFCLFMGRILTSDSEKMVGRGVKQLDRALGIFKFVWEMAEMKGHLDLQGHMWCVGADNRMLRYRGNTYFVHGICL
ncbi:hypothetical protein JHK82_013228 [Glycine max]|uniref:Uncharacterized protein n=1 Tax=Glycine max TaxID=3847 RepID=I1K4D9_SOYBN|nr:uncharacterized protein LOC100788302 [Glycine max]KAG4391380.1 hypothetical protein GLYMA_05G173000v4 [Glycine max]KAG5041121.1 hypothetical protein JHK85_013597 [Glycine max]KAG5155259.1 hypothetical protein JHK82_013228 [Glycine max]KAH1134891.1 hypothetical protein GYH30_012956 [Glycine max]KRH59232.1 hypothetical protein GLYMA_05G173000v4 [Glycine max]|eukprot:XP_003524247.1 uncharacterized protein LOC100788302 [Glycine max]